MRAFEKHEDGRPRRLDKGSTEHGRKTSDGMHAGDGESERTDYRHIGSRLEEGFRMMHGLMPETNRRLEEDYDPDEDFDGEDW